MTKETIAVCTAIVSAVAALVVVPEVRDWTCTNFDSLCKRDSISAPTVPKTPGVSIPTSPTPAQPTRLESAESLRSFPSSQPTSITFANTLDLPVTVFWRDFGGTEKIYMNLGPGQSYEQQTFTTHAWVVRESASGSIVLTIVASERPQIARIGRP